MDTISNGTPFSERDAVDPDVLHYGDVSGIRNFTAHQMLNSSGAVPIFAGQMA